MFHKIIITGTVCILMALSPAYDQGRIEEGLIAHWTFDDQTGNTLRDQSDQPSHGTIKGNPQWSRGIIGKGALEFDGQGDFVEILENKATPEKLQKLNKGTISIWFKARNIPVGRSILPILYYGNKDGCPDMFDASNEGFIIEIGHGRVYPRAKGVFYTVFSNKCELPSLCYDSHSDPHLQHEQGIIEENQWYHFVVVIGEDFNTGYLNGEELNYRHYNFNTSRATQFFADALKHQRMWIGKGHWNHAQEVYFDGMIDDLRIYNRPLNTNEVKQLYGMKNDL